MSWTHNTFWQRTYKFSSYLSRVWEKTISYLSNIYMYSLCQLIIIDFPLFEFFLKIFHHCFLKILTAVNKNNTLMTKLSPCIFIYFEFGFIVQQRIYWNHQHCILQLFFPLDHRHHHYHQIITTTMTKTTLVWSSVNLFYLIYNFWVLSKICQPFRQDDP